MRWSRAIVLGAWGMVLSAAPADAAAGLSDIGATEACWIRRPYALMKCQSDRGRYPAELVRARPMTREEY